MESLAQLAEFTGRSESECQALLQLTNGNYDAAANLALDGVVLTPMDAPRATAARENTGASPDAAPFNMSLMEELNQDLVSDAAPHVPQRPRMVQSSSLIWRPLAWLVGWICSLRIVGRAAGKFAGVFAGQPTGTDPFNPQKAATKFTSALAQIAPHAVEFAHESYHQTLLDAKNNLRYMLVVVVAWQHEDNANLVKLLEEDSLRRLVERHNILSWGGSLDSSEAYQVVLGFKATKYPFVALVGPTPKTAQSNIVVMESLLKRPLCDFKDSQDLVHTIEEKIFAHDPKVQALRLDREANEADRSVRQQQDDAYEESLRQDRARAQERQRQQQEQEQREREHQSAAQQLEEWKKVRAYEFAHRQLNGPTCRVQFRTSSGRHVAKFAESDTLQTLYEYVLCLNVEGHPGDLPELSPEFAFKLVSPPRHVLHPEPTCVKQVAEIWPSGALVVDE